VLLLYQLAAADNAEKKAAQAAMVVPMSCGLMAISKSRD
jgi:hypothetical protein